ncbi:MAG: InlB B-repeat-containing protein [Lachnospiraceae bacterium]|nr:InlB B-repeat-containing protein [Candidatus Colinaster scatohippi]
MKKKIKRIIAGLMTSMVLVTSLPVASVDTYAKESVERQDELVNDAINSSESFDYSDEESQAFTEVETSTAEAVTTETLSEETEDAVDEEESYSEEASTELFLEEELTDEYIDDDPQNGRAEAQKNLDPASLIPFSEALSDDIALAYIDTGKYNHGKYASNFDIKKGIDVSKHQGVIDWKKVAADGVDFALIRVAARGYGDAGNFIDDEKYAANIKGAQAAGIPVGVYIFSQAITETEAIEEADRVLKNIKGYTIQLPVVMDFEYAATSSGVGGRLYNAKLSKDAATRICNAFCSKIAAAGYDPMVYANYDMLTNHLNASQISSKYKIWIARWNTSTGYSGEYNYWQFTDKGSVNGITGAVDLDFGYMEFEDKPDTDRLVSKVNAKYYDEKADRYISIEDGSATNVNPETEVVLSSDTENTAIFYSMGTTPENTPVPTINTGIRYTEPIIVSADAYIKALAVKTNFKDSELSGFSFKLNDVSGDQDEVVNEDMPEGATQSDKVAAISNDFWTSKVDEQVYTGKAIKPVIRVYAGKKLLNEKTDYTLALRNNVNVGTAVITITGRGNYTGSSQTTFEIVQRDISDAVAEMATVTVPYNKRNQAMPVALTVDGRKLALNKDYVISIVKKGETESDPDVPVTVCNAPGTYIYTIKAKEKGNYYGSGTVAFNIRDNVTSLATAKFKVANQSYLSWYSMGDNPDIDSDDCFVDPADSSRRFALEGPDSGIRPQIVVTDNKNNIISESEYDITYSNNNAVGSAKVTITAKPESEYFVGSKTVAFMITGQPITKATVTYTDVESGITQDISRGLSLVYNGREHEPLGKVDVYDDVPDNIEIKYTLKKDEPPLVLKKGRDFTVSYLNNVKAGNATIVITGKGRFTGVLRKGFKINDYIVPETEKLSEHILVKMVNPDKTETLDDPINGSKRIVPEYYYVKGGVTPVLKVYYEPEKVVTPLTDAPSANAIELVAGVDYTVKHIANKTSNNFDAANAKNASIAPTVTIVGRKSFKGNVSVTYSIIKADLGRMTITAADKACTGKVGQYAVAPVLTDPYNAKNAKLVAGVDYEKTLEYRLAEANYVMKYDPVLRRSFRRWVAADTLLNPATDIITDNTAIKVTARGKGNYENTVSTVYRMNTLDIAKAVVKVADQNYVGKAVRPGKKDVTSITIKVGGATVNLNPEDYEITGYQKNTGRGTGIMTIHGLGAYCGYKNVTFKINARSLFYIIEYKSNSDSATGAMANQNVIIKGTKLTAVKYKYPGYEFTGWNTEADGSGDSYANAQELGIIYPGAKLTLYAQWRLINYKLVFNNNAPAGENVVGSIGEVILSGVEKYVLPRTGIRCDGYILSGWKINGKTYSLGATVSLLATKDGETVTANAVWTMTPERRAYNAMIAFKARYPEGTRWTNDNYYGWNGGIYTGGYGCAGFAFMLSDAAFGNAPAYMHYNYNNIRVGDILRVKNSYGGEHSVIVLKVEGDVFTLAEGNYNNSVHWGRTMTRDEVKRNGIYVMSRW